MNNYKAIKIDGVKHDAHRHIMEQHLGRKLGFDEVVHHIDGNRINNNIHNLCVMSRSEHSRIHRLGTPISDAAKQKLSERYSGKPRHFCRKLTKETVFDILRLGRDGVSSRKIASMLNVNRSAVYQILSGNTYRDWVSEFE